jgi:hypothetical protein
MHKNLVEHIIDGEYVEAQAAMKSRLDAIVEQKLLEVKRSIDLVERVEATGTKDEDGNPQFKGQNNKKDWKEYRKQHPTMSFHGTPSNPKARASREKHEKTSTGTLTKHGIEARRKRGFLQAHHVANAMAFMKGISNYHKTGKLNQKDFSSIQAHLDETAALDDIKGAARQVKVDKVTKYLEKRAKRKLGKLKGSSSSSSSGSGNFISKMTQAGKDAENQKNSAGAKLSQGMSQAGKDATAAKEADRVERRTKAVGAIKKVGQFAADVFSTPWEESYQMQESAWRDIPKGKKAHPLGKPKNVIKSRRLRARKLGKRTFNEE